MSKKEERAVAERYGFDLYPFDVGADQRFLYLSAGHQAALDRCMSCVDDKGGLAVVYGEIGTGKTILSRRLGLLLEDEEGVDVYYAAAITTKTDTQFLGRILQAFNISSEGLRGYFKLSMRLYDFLGEQYDKDRTPALIIDDAQALTLGQLELLRQLLNMEMSDGKLLQLVLLGQTELLLKIRKRPNIKSRIVGISNLDPLSQNDAVGLINHRLKVAGATTAARREEIFPASAREIIAKGSRGFPRECVLLCAAALKTAWRSNMDGVTEEIARDHVAYVDFHKHGIVDKEVRDDL